MREGGRSDSCINRGAVEVTLQEVPTLAFTCKRVTGLRWTVLRFASLSFQPSSCRHSPTHDHCRVVFAIADSIRQLKVR